MSENFSIKCFLCVFTVSVQLEEGDWFIYIYICDLLEFNMYMYLCALRIKSKKWRNINSYAVSDGSLP